MFKQTLVASIALLSAPASADFFPTVAGDERPPEADLILMNGEVSTPTGWVEAVAVDQGAVIAVGTAEQVAALRGPSTQVVDLRGAAVLPGLHDLHVHAIGGGLEHSSCTFPSGATPQVIRDTVAACVAEAEPGEWIRGGNWIAAVFAPGQQTREFLDEVSPNNPVILSDESHHSLWANSAAIAAAGITAATQDPENGIIDRDASGRPTGLFRERATGLVSAAMPPIGEQQMREGLQYAADLMSSYGITSFTDAGLDAPGLKVMSEMSAEGLMKQRVRGCIRWAEGPVDARQQTEALIHSRQYFRAERFRPDCVKVVLDGVPTESHTAAMLDHYVSTTEKGMSIVPPEVLFPAITEFDRQGLHVKFHAAGDGAVRQAIDAVAAAREANGMGGPAHDVGHNSFVDPEDLARVRQLAMSWEFSPYIWYPSPITRDIKTAVGPERMERWIPIADAVNAGGLVGPGSDWSVVPSINPWLAIETMVTRQVPGGSAETLGSSQKVSLNEAMTIFTSNAAQIMEHRNLVGSIEPGMLADMVVVERNPFRVPETEIHRTKVLMTFINGEKVYDAASPPTSLSHR
ncbi:amidohydrolase [Altericroceibacterium xinjiangense]|uniref:amidohydrolase n=1 Tax=Altericroceibacterium xinjiangense TaxID=762261 RepID=UPI000F7EE466|nr:amidohydrolase [Altericroceibacterium xinjiangense]